MIGGSFTAYNGTDRNSIARLNSDGSLDTNFNPGTGLTGSNNFVSSIALQSDGKILIGGGFITYNNYTTFHVCRIIGSTDTTSISIKQNKSFLTLYPNPAKGQFFVNVANPTTVQVLNSLGQVVITQKVAGITEINTASLPSGLYTVLAEGYKATSLIITK